VNTAPLNYVAESTKGEDATKIGVGAIGGAIVGGILGGGSGAAKGAAIASLASPLTVRVSAR
jgi:outer membrane lipoprotein SlyB